MPWPSPTPRGGQQSECWSRIHAVCLAPLPVQTGACCASPSSTLRPARKRQLAVHLERGEGQAAGEARPRCHS